MRRVGWFLLILGISLGTIFGLYYAWEIGPIDPKDAVPSDLEEQFQEELRTLIAIAYANTGDLNRAIRRLDLLSVPGDSQYLKILAQQHLAEGRPEQDIRSVAQLAAALATQESDPTTPQSSFRTVTPTSSPIPPPTTTPTPTSSRTPIPAYQLSSIEEICDAALSDPLIQVMIYDAIGEPVPGIEVIVSWDEGDDHFFTGLKSEMGHGYGDFMMSENISYSIQITGTGDPVANLNTVKCFDENDEPYIGSWLLIFDEPVP